MSLDEPQEQDMIKVINQIQVAFAGNIVDYTNDLVLEYYKENNGFALIGGSSC
ncbi:hypothetical protein [Neobacillus sp. LXY-4]|uniref:hypothetical protein n=1 Tax=Neobacillus sp. LXY-4 TaxID=3379826 RepID=UPI003EDFB9F4